MIGFFPLQLFLFLFVEEIIEALFRLRLPLLLRTALDDTNNSIIVSAVAGLTVLLTKSCEERFYDSLWGTLRGTEVCPLLPAFSIGYASPNF